MEAPIITRDVRGDASRLLTTADAPEARFEHGSTIEEPVAPFGPTDGRRVIYRLRQQCVDECVEKA